MYATRTEMIVSAGNARAYETAWTPQFIALHKTQPGFQSSLLLNALSYPGKYVLLIRWDNREARQTFAKGEAFSAFMQAHPPQAFGTLGRPREAYDVCCRVAGDGQPGYVTLVDWTLDARPGNAASFERSRQELFEIRKQCVPGFVFNALGRLDGHLYRYQVLGAYRTREALQAANPDSTIPQLQAFLGAHPFSAYASTPLQAEAYEVVLYV